MHVTQWRQAGHKGVIMSTQVLTGGVTVTAQDTSVVSDELQLKSFAGLYFDIIQEHSVSLQNQITDNYIENNTAIQDHIAHSPLVVSLRGLSGELVYTPPMKALNWAYSQSNQFAQGVFNAGSTMANTNILTDKLTVIPALLPPVDNVTQMAKNAVQYVESSVNRYIKIFKNFTSDTQRQTRLQQIYEDLAALRAANVLLAVETPYADFYDMAIQSITLRQGNENHITDVELTLKQINYASTLTTKPDESVMAKYNAIQRTEEANHGKAQGVEVDSNTIIGSWAVKFGAKPGGGVRKN